MNSNSFKTIMLALVGVIAFMVSSAQADDIAITGGRVVTVGAAGTIENGTVLISDGRIQAVGANIAVPDGYRVIDASGKWVTPGLMNAATRLGLSEIGLEATTNDHTINQRRPGGGGGFGGGQATPMALHAAFDPSPGFNPNTVYIPVTRLEGVTRAIVIPGSNDSVFGGQAFAIDLSGREDSITKTGVAMTAVLGRDGGLQAGQTRGSAYYALLESLREAAAYARRGNRSLPNREEDSLLSGFEAAALGPVISGQMPLYVAVNRASDIRATLKLKDEFRNLKLILIEAAEGWMVADEIAAAGVPVVVDTHANLPVNFGQVGATMENAGRLQAAGVTVIIGARNLDGTGNARLVAQAAGNAVAHGMPWDAAIAAITINPARVFGLADKYGSLESGKDADVVVWNGDPLELMSNVDFLTIRGEEIPLVSRQTELRDRYMDLTHISDRPPAYHH